MNRSMHIGFVGGLIPALSALRFKPLEALRGQAPSGRLWTRRRTYVLDGSTVIETRRIVLHRRLKPEHFR